MAERHRLLVFIDGIEQGHLRNEYSTEQLDELVQAIVMSTSMDYFVQRRVRLVICNLNTSWEDICTWVHINSMSEGGLDDGNNKDVNGIEEIDCVEIKKNIDLMWQIEDAAQERKKQEIKDKVEQGYSELTREQRDEVVKVFKGEDEGE